MTQCRHNSGSIVWAIDSALYRSRSRGIVLEVEEVVEVSIFVLSLLNLRPVDGVLGFHVSLLRLEICPSPEVAIIDDVPAGHVEERGDQDGSPSRPHNAPDSGTHRGSDPSKTPVGGQSGGLGSQVRHQDPSFLQIGGNI